jgi:hypothetical protein
MDEIVRNLVIKYISEHAQMSESLCDSDHDQKAKLSDKPQSNKDKMLLKAKLLMVFDKL